MICDARIERFVYHANVLKSLMFGGGAASSTAEAPDASAGRPALPARRPRILSNDLFEAERHPRIPRARLQLSRAAGRAQAPDAALGADARAQRGRRPARRLHGFD